MTDHDTVTLTFPRTPHYYGVARLVVGGMAAGLSLSVEALDELQLAISSLVDSDDLPNAHESLTLRLEVGPDSMRASIGAFTDNSVAPAFERTGGQGGDFSLRRVLDTIVDTVEITTVDGHDWVTLTKRVKAAV